MNDEVRMWICVTLANGSLLGGWIVLSCAWFGLAAVFAVKDARG